jgi:hypothetical protein
MTYFLIPLLMFRNYHLAFGVMHIVMPTMLWICLLAELISIAETVTKQRPAKTWNTEIVCYRHLLCAISYNCL